MEHSPESEKLVLVFIPTLVSLLVAAEKAKGSALSEEEVVSIRDKATCMVLPFSVALAGDDARGYVDIVAEDCWLEWQRARLEILSSKD